MPLLDGLLHGALALGVERRGGFVEDPDLGVLVQRAGDRQALALAARELAAVGADGVFEPLGLGLHEVPEVGCGLAGLAAKVGRAQAGIARWGPGGCGSNEQPWSMGVLPAGRGFNPAAKYTK